MQSFTYCAPTRIVFGPGTQEKAGEEIVRAGGQRVLVLYGGQSAVRSGLIDAVCDRLQQAGLAYEKEEALPPTPGRRRCKHSSGATRGGRSTLCWPWAAAA